MREDIVFTKYKIGTKIEFIQELCSPPTSDTPEFLYAKKGELGIITGYNDYEGYMVKTDSYPHSFGAVINKEFKIV